MAEDDVVTALLDREFKCESCGYPLAPVVMCRNRHYLRCQTSRGARADALKAIVICPMCGVESYYCHERGLGTL